MYGLSPQCAFNEHCLSILLFKSRTRQMHAHYNALRNYGPASARARGRAPRGWYTVNGAATAEYRPFREASMLKPMLGCVAMHERNVEASERGMNGVLESDDGFLFISDAGAKITRCDKVCILSSPGSKSDRRLTVIRYVRSRLHPAGDLELALVARRRRPAPFTRALCSDEGLKGDCVNRPLDFSKNVIRHFLNTIIKTKRNCQICLNWDTLAGFTAFMEQCSAAFSR